MSFNGNGNNDGNKERNAFNDLGMSNANDQNDSIGFSITRMGSEPIPVPGENNFANIHSIGGMNSTTPPGACGHIILPTIPAMKAYFKL